MLLAEARLTYSDGSEAVIGSVRTGCIRALILKAAVFMTAGIINKLLYEGIDNPYKAPVLAQPEGRPVPRYSLPVIENMAVEEVIRTFGR